MKKYINLSLIIIGLLCCVSLHAESYEPQAIEPYPDESVQTIRQTVGNLESDFGKITVSLVNLQKAQEKYKINPSDENSASLTEERGRVFYDTMEFVNNANGGFVKVIPELRKLSAYLEKYAACIDEKNPLMKQNAKQMREKAKALETLVSNLKEIQEGFKLLKKDFKTIGAIWINTQETNCTLREIFGKQNISDLIKDMSGVIDSLSKVKGALIDSMEENSLDSSPEENQEDMNKFRNSLRNLLQGTRR